MLGLVEKDPWLSDFEDIIQSRIDRYKLYKKQIEDAEGSLYEFANAHNYYGLHKTKKGWVFREFAPGAEKIVLIGDFTEWKQSAEYELTRLVDGSWELEVGADKIKHGDLYKMVVFGNGQYGERLPSYVQRVVQDEETHLFSAQVWEPENKYVFKNKPVDLKDKSPFIYECHVGMGTEEYKVGSYSEFKDNVLPYIKELGYNTLQIMAIQEHPYYGSFGYHISNFFAASSRQGTPEELKELIDEAHGMGIAVVLDVVHSHAVKNELEGIGNLDYSGNLYFFDNDRRDHPAWDSYCFDYGRWETKKFLLSNCRYWLEEYQFDGFRFDGVTSMLYYNHGLEKAYTEYVDYFNGEQDEDAIAYLTLANKLIHKINPNAITIAEEMSGMPGLAGEISDGGIGFDYRMAMGIPDFWIKLIKESSDEDWKPGGMHWQLTNHRVEEKTINYAESHDQALVGDKSIIFRLIDKEMYYHMMVDDDNLTVDRGMALHKMIRLITASCMSGGYLNFMGNEFGHPEWIDFPREGNNWSYHYARRQWSLVKNKDLKYKFLFEFDKAMVELLSSEAYFAESYNGIVIENSGDQVIIYRRKDLIFVFNFNPTQSFVDYGFITEEGEYKVVLSSDSKDFGGFNRIDESITYATSESAEKEPKHWLKLYIPSRSAFVLRKTK